MVGVVVEVGVGVVVGVGVGEVVGVFEVGLELNVDPQSNACRKAAGMTPRPSAVLPCPTLDGVLIAPPAYHVEQSTRHVVLLPACDLLASDLGQIAGVRIGQDLSVSILDVLVMLAPPLAPRGLHDHVRIMPVALSVRLLLLASQADVVFLLPAVWVVLPNDARLGALEPKSGSKLVPCLLDRQGNHLLSIQLSYPHYRNRGFAKGSKTPCFAGFWGHNRRSEKRFDREFAL